MAFTTLVPAPPLRQAISMIWDWHVEPEWSGSSASCADRARGDHQPAGRRDARLHRRSRTSLRAVARRGLQRPVHAQLRHRLDRTDRGDGRDLPPGRCVQLARGTDGSARQPAYRIGRSGWRIGSDTWVTPVNTSTPQARLDVLQGWLRPLPRKRRCLGRRIRTGCSRPRTADSSIGALLSDSGLSARRFGTLFPATRRHRSEHDPRMQRFRSVVRRVEHGHTRGIGAHRCRLRLPRPAAPRTSSRIRRHDADGTAAQRGVHVNHVVIAPVDHQA